MAITTTPSHQLEIYRQELEELLSAHPELEDNESDLVEITLEAYDLCLDAVESGASGQPELVAFELCRERLVEARDRLRGPTAIAAVNRALSWSEMVGASSLSADLAASLIRGEKERLRSRGDALTIKAMEGLAQALEQDAGPTEAVRSLTLAAQRPPQTGLEAVDRMLAAWSALDFAEIDPVAAFSATEGAISWSLGLRGSVDSILDTHADLAEQLADVLDGLADLASWGCQQILQSGAFAWRVPAEEALELAQEFRELIETVGEQAARESQVVCIKCACSNPAFRSHCVSCGRALARVVIETGRRLDLSEASLETPPGGAFLYLKQLVADLEEGFHDPRPLLSEIARLRLALAKLSTAPVAPAHGGAVTAALRSALERIAAVLKLLQQGAELGRLDLLREGRQGLDQASSLLSQLRELTVEPTLQNTRMTA